MSRKTKSSDESAMNKLLEEMDFGFRQFVRQNCEDLTRLRDMDL